jgi:hypothetical protein
MQLIIMCLTVFITADSALAFEHILGAIRGTIPGVETYKNYALHL